MLRMRTSFQRTLARLMVQVGGSLVATLIASVIFQALPKAPSADQPLPALTSGGKFAARVPGAEPLITESPLQRSIAIPAMVHESAASMLIPADDFAWDNAVKPQPPVDAGRPKARPAAVAHDGKRTAGGSLAAAPSKSTVGLAAEVAAPAASASDDGLMHKAVASARSLWSMTASAGGGLLSRLTP